jgi:hypothetical protein
MSWHFSRALEAEYLQENCSDGEQYAAWKSTPFALDDSCSAKMKDTYHRSLFGTMFVPLTDTLGADVLTWFLADFLAPTSVQQGSRLELTEKPAAFGWNLQGSFARFDRLLCSWRTRQCSLIEGSEEFLGIWPRWGSMRDGECLDLTTLAPSIEESGSGLWPTPCHGSSRWGGTFQEVGGSQNKLRGTPTGRMYVNPDFWENLMGWPTGWTGIAPLETGKTREWQQRHSPSSPMKSNDGHDRRSITEVIP